MKKSLLFSALLFAGHAAGAAPLPVDVSNNIPGGFDVVTYAKGDLNGDSHPDYVVALSKKDEQAEYQRTGKAPRRPLLLFMGQADGSFASAKRNDAVILALDEGGQCDPFDGEDGLAMKGRYFTVQNGVACGQHWTDYITFRYDARLRDVVFYKNIVEFWKMSDGTDPDADALVLDKRDVKTASPGKPVSFDKYRPD
jgi:hypothetical protein